MTDSHTIVALRDLTDQAEPGGFGDAMEARFARAALGAERAPDAVRAFEAGDAGLEFLAFGAHTDGDAELVEADWPQ